MIRALIAALSWLDKRFPPKVTVTKEMFEALIEREHQRMKTATMIRMDLDTQRERIDGAEKSIHALKDLLAKSADPAVKAESRRAAFVATGRMPPE